MSIYGDDRVKAHDTFVRPRLQARRGGCNVVVIATQITGPRCYDDIIIATAVAAVALVVVVVVVAFQ